GVTALSNGNFVVNSFSWGSNDVGAVTWGNGTTGQLGTATFGAISSANSLVGSLSNDQVGIGGITVLNNGNFVVRSRLWDNGGALDAGAVTWGNGTTGQLGTGTFGPVSPTNSLVGSSTFDNVGNGGVTALSNGNFVVESYVW